MPNGLYKFDPDIVRFELKRQFHALKHFTALNSSAFTGFIERGYSKEEIENRLRTVGSKFSPEFVESPAEILEVLKRSKFIVIHKGEIKHEAPDRLSIDIDKNDYPNGIGKDALILLSDIPENQNIHKKPVKGFMLNFISGKLRSTNILNIIFNKFSESPVIHTIFPGEYAPPIPDYEKQPEMEYKENLSFWEKHALIEEGL